jgi:GH25 family lysozyme M1 (1,4-beta-N-acetylmuramidase)
VTHLGRDFSSFQGTLSDADVAGIEFAYVKATQGGGDTAYQNPDAPAQVAKLRAAGVHVGFYHFLDPAATLLDQVHEFQLYVGALGGTDLPLALDSETQDNAGWPTLATLMVDFAMNVEAWTTPVPNPKSMFYVNVSFYDALAGFPWGRDVWLANPGVAAPQKPCLVWQQAPRPVSSSDTKVIDPDVFMGTEAQWAAFTGGVVLPAPTPAGPPPNAVPGPNGLEVRVIGLMQAGGRYQGYPALDGATVYAGVGDPTEWKVGLDLKTVPAGTPLAVSLADSEAGKVGTTVVVEQL